MSDYTVMPTLTIIMFPEVIKCHEWIISNQLFRSFSIESMLKQKYQNENKQEKMPAVMTLESAVERHLDENREQVIAGTKSGLEILNVFLSIDSVMSGIDGSIAIVGK